MSVVRPLYVRVLCHIALAYCQLVIAGDIPRVRTSVATYAKHNALLLPVDQQWSDDTCPQHSSCTVRIVNDLWIPWCWLQQCCTVLALHTWITIIYEWPIYSEHTVWPPWCYSSFSLVTILLSRSEYYLCVCSEAASRLSSRLRCPRCVEVVRRCHHKQTLSEQNPSVSLQILITVTHSSPFYFYLFYLFFVGGEIFGAYSDLYKQMLYESHFRYICSATFRWHLRNCFRTWFILKWYNFFNFYLPWTCIPFIWACTFGPWQILMGGIRGVVVSHPLQPTSSATSKWGIPGAVCCRQPVASLYLLCTGTPVP